LWAEWLLAPTPALTSSDLLFVGGCVYETWSQTGDCGNSKTITIAYGTASGAVNNYYESHFDIGKYFVPAAISCNFSDHYETAISRFIVGAGAITSSNGLDISYDIGPASMSTQAGDYPGLSVDLLLVATP
jgi:hypothetical protein